MAAPRTLIEDYAGVTVATVTDNSLLESAKIDQWGKELMDLVDKQNKKKLVLDFSNVKFLSSAALGVLLSLNKKSTEIKGELVLCGLRAELMKMFKITQLDRIFKFFPNDSAALASFGVHVS